MSTQIVHYVKGVARGGKDDAAGVEFSETVEDCLLHEALFKVLRLLCGGGAADFSVS